jgi:hypothetical protein
MTEDWPDIDKDYQQREPTQSRVYQLHVLYAGLIESGQRTLEPVLTERTRPWKKVSREYLTLKRLIVRISF